jgi:predicted nucleotidyltransferase
MNPDLDRWSSRLAIWAKDKREISELWLFGSRVRGDNRDDSDLDVAVIMAGDDEGDRLGNWIALAEEWEEELKILIPIAVDLDIGDADISEKVVAPALKREGVRIFSRNENKQ